MKLITRFFFVLFFLFSVSASAVSGWDKFSYDSYAARNFSQWPQWLDKMTEQAFSTTGTIDQQIQVMTGYYGYIGHLLDIKEKDKAGVWSKKANGIFKKLKQSAPDDPRVLALQSMFVAYDIAISPVKAPFQAGGMMSTAKKALKEDPGLYLANLANANILFYFPEALGGDKHKAITYYMNVYNYFKSNPQIAANSWMYLNVMSTLAVANEAVGDSSKAFYWCQEALRVNPAFVYVKTILLPRIQQKAA